MQLVIDIQDEMYKKVMNENFKMCEGKYAWKIYHGTPLPKGHGRLVDIDAIKPIKAPIAPLTYEEGVHYEWIYMKNRVDDAPTIIEADREKKRDET